MNAVSATFRREVSALPEIFDLVARFFSGAGGEQSLRHTVEFVLEEIFTNSVKYNPTGNSGIGISLVRESDELKVTLTDFDSEPFDIRTEGPPVDPFLPLEEREPGGLGVHLVRRMMDRIEYDYADRVSTITLIKSLGK